MKRPEALFLTEMRDAAVRIVELVDQNAAQDLRSDQTRQDALLWNFTVLGEAARKLPETFTSAHARVPWHRAIGLRNRVVHGYWSIDIDILTTTAAHDLPPLIDELTRLLGSLDTDEEGRA